ncbi:phosphoribosyltransferase [Clostridium sp. WB02_MRS01]|uniref:phosphoribosyltransferase family protein n=1 Tax=Clostridium sp. WB02_MRS01 TaxID=2605777 RepID=UPI0012B21F4D|nr:phosphoribosyltransferase family protein [Clostridium sp. WB02_MRS01]MSS10793.1 phosphoribosyltransferase [Clostridium sp. WB02_MRS01]
MNFRTVADMNACINKYIGKVPHDVDLIVGIPRSGMLVASLLGLYLNLPIVDLHTFLDGKVYQTGTTRKQKKWIGSVDEAKHILVVDDSISTGEAMKNAKSALQKLSLRCKITYSVIYAVPTAASLVDFYFEICNHPRIFEWNYMHAWTLEYACVDIDGVLCEDPGIQEALSKYKYEEFIANAAPKLLPTKKVGYLVTSRKEQYRQATEAWLEKNNVEYNNLVMLPEKKASDVMGNVEYGAYKAEIYKKTNCFLFIESNYEQAVKICELSGRQVFCVENHQLVTPDNLISCAAMVKRDGLIAVKRVFKKLLKKL